MENAFNFELTFHTSNIKTNKKCIITKTNDKFYFFSLIMIMIQVNMPDATSNANAPS